jgi:large subunit ribosomal protein L11
MEKAPVTLNDVYAEIAVLGKVTNKQLLEIVELKKKDLNAINPDNAARMIAGTARSMGIEVVG